MTPKMPYIGSTISLVSKLDIRYEGVLFTVNSAEGTIVLTQVRCFGTEDRPTANPILVQDIVHECVTFKAAEIKDLAVRRTPNSSPVIQPGSPFNDPAVLSFSKHRSAKSSSAPHMFLTALQTAPTSAAYSRYNTPTRRGQKLPPNAYYGVADDREKYYMQQRRSVLSVPMEANISLSRYREY